MDFGTNLILSVTGKVKALLRTIIITHILLFRSQEVYTQMKLIIFVYSYNFITVSFTFIFNSVMP